MYTTTPTAAVVALVRPTTYLDLAFDPKGRYVAWSSKDGQIAVWDVEKNAPLEPIAEHQTFFGINHAHATAIEVHGFGVDNARQPRRLSAAPGGAATEEAIAAIQNQ